MTKKTACIAAFTILSLLGCKKEATTWETNWKVPLVKGKITIQDVLPNHHVENDDEFVSLVYNDTVYTFDIDTLIKLPDTTISHKTAIQLPQWTLSPGDIFPTFDINQNYDLGNISLKRVTVEKGKGQFSIFSTWPGKTKAEFSFPKLKEADGTVFKREYILEAGSTANPYIVIDSFEMAGFDFDLTGTNGDLYNNVTAFLTMSSEETADNFTVTNLDTVELKVSFSDMTPKYALGYFGSYEITDTTEILIPEMQKLSGILNLDSIRMNLTIRNGFDLTAQTKITQVEGLNTKNNQTVLLNFPFLNQFININPATGGLWDHAPSDYEIDINNTNSNVLGFIENLPDALKFGFSLHVNPDGNGSNGTDQFFPNSSIDLLLDGELPLTISMNDFSLTDTFDITINDIQNTVNEGEFKLKYTNSFPISAQVLLSLLNESGTALSQIQGDQIMNSGTYDINSQTTTASNGEIVFTLDKTQINNLTEASKIALIVKFNTYNQNEVNINLSDSIDFKLFSSLDLNLSLK